MHNPVHLLAPPAPVAPSMTIGLLGGSFNPAHRGHCHISTAALKRLGLDYVWWLVAPQNPLKPAMGMAPFDHRIADAREIAKHPRIAVLDIEHRIGTRYTIDTLSVLQRRFPYVHFVWLMGSDNLESFHRWKDWQDIAARIPIAVVMRPGSALAPLKARAAQFLCGHRFPPSRKFARAYPPALTVLDGPRDPLSATAIRAANLEQEALVGALPAC